MTDLAIEVKELTKTYRLGTDGGYQTLREALTPSFRRSRRHPTDGREIHALRQVDLNVDEGTALGVIGRNGAGKSTLLKILARITEPTSGLARTRGHVGALLEVGTGFHSELTGAENIYLNGAILGMSRRDIARRFAEISGFAGVEPFLDTPLKRYSDGMRLRLAFAVAAHLESEIIVVDEILATGDADFQAKCLGKMSEFGRQGRTVVFVSHDLGAVARLCSRALWLEQGSIVEDGEATAVVNAYVRSGARSAVATFPIDRTQAVQLSRVALTDAKGETVDWPRRDEPLQFRFLVRVHQRTPGLDLGFYLVNGMGTQVLVDAWSDSRAPNQSPDEPGDYEAVAEIPPILAAGQYVLRLWIGTAYDEDLVDQEVLRFTLHPRQDERSLELERARAVAPPIPWRVTRLPEHS